MFSRINFKPVVMSCLLMVACGDSEEDQIVQRFSYAVENNSIEFEVEFNQDFELNTDVVIPVRDYGDVKLMSPADGNGFIIGGKVNLDAFVDDDFLSLEQTRSLPNNQPMSRYVQTDVARLRVQASEQVATSIYLGLDPEMFYLGSAVELGFMGEDFPSGLVISQRIRDKERRQLGVITIYGPEIKDGEVLNPGGIFFITNVSELINYYGGKDEKVNHDMHDLSSGNALYPEDQTYISEEHQEDLDSKRDLRKLMKLYRKSAKDAGMID